jgi:hypothetical protein
LKSLITFSLIFISSIILTANTSNAGIDIGLKIDDDGLKSFHVAIGEHYNVPEKEVIVIKKKHFTDEELPVIFFLARHAKVRPDVIVQLRLGGKSWLSITRHFGLGLDLFYVPVTKVSGPPYGKAYGHFKNKPRKKWREIRLTDSDVVNLVNLKFVSVHYGWSPDEVMEMRSNGRTFVEINHTVKQKKASQKNKQASVNKKKAKGKKK